MSQRPLPMSWAAVPLVRTSEGLERLVHSHDAAVVVLARPESQDHDFYYVAGCAEDACPVSTTVNAAASHVMVAVLDSDTLSLPDPLPGHVVVHQCAPGDRLEDRLRQIYVAAADPALRPLLRDPTSRALALSATANEGALT